MSASLICSRCHAENAAGSRYCDQCSTLLQPASHSVPAPAAVSRGAPPPDPRLSCAPDAPSQGLPDPEPPGRRPATPPRSAGTTTPAAELPAGTTGGRTGTVPGGTEPARPARRGHPGRLYVLLLAGALLAAIVFLAALVQSAMLMGSGPAAPRSAGGDADATRAAELLDQQATVLAGQQTITAQYNAQATSLAEQPAHLQATMTAISRVAPAGGGARLLTAAIATATAQAAGLDTRAPRAAAPTPPR